MRKTVAILYAMLCGLLCNGAAVSVQMRSLSERDGLSHNNVNCVIQDSKGYIWVGTKDGASRYDGSSFHNFRPGAANHSIHEGQNGVLCLCDAGGRIWAGSESGVFLFDEAEGRFRPFDEVTDYGVNIASAVQCLSIADDGALWIGTRGQGIFIYKEKLVQHSEHVLFVQCIAQGSDGRMWAASKGGGIHIFRADGEYLSKIDTGAEISCILPDNERMWLAGQGGLSCYEDGVLHASSIPAGRSLKSIALDLQMGGGNFRRGRRRPVAAQPHRRGVPGNQPCAAVLGE